MARKALIVWGGWLGHEPEQVTEIFERTLVKEGFSVEVSDTLESLEDVEKLKALHLIVPVWTMGEISHEQVAAVSDAVANGTGMAGCHGGMCDAFRTSVQWEFITGGTWVSHPGGDGVEYVVNIKHSSSPIVAGLHDFKVKSEQYYLHVDPSNEVLATTTFGGDYAPWIDGCVMPVVWKRKWGEGRVFYCSLGHVAADFDVPEAREMVRRGMHWATRG